ncbi:glycoside hydrolase family 19 protein [Cupriavidus campinensis]|uniref:glycoside hydrolase family 19 protein n=1 Tax=Cupriavidus campinensis TaxID=151783 RepID=UPI0024E1BDCC|nr:glycoside hydrolase family 19 protein [Cupriavidus campinensis]
MTSDQLRAIMPLAGMRAQVFAIPLNEAMAEFNIDTARRQAAFIAQIAHESGQLRYTRELWGPTIAQTRYEGRTDLGNVEPGDGKRFMGRGLIQITGRSNYVKCGFALGLDLVAQPELLEEPESASRSAAWFWFNSNLNRYADADDFAGLTRRINGGLNGLEDRKYFWARAWKELGV